MISVSSGVARSGLRAGSALTIGAGGKSSPVYGALNMVGNSRWVTGAVGLIDIDSVISVDDGDGTSSIKPEYNQDNVHANPAGQRAIADYMKTVFV